MCVMMGGFEQQYFSKDGERLALLVNGAPDLHLNELPGVCKGDGVSGIVYGLSEGRFEVIAEGEKTLLDGLIDSVRSAAGADASLREAWQAPVGGYTDAFPIVELAPKMGARITLTAQEETLDYIQRHLQIEAVFNRGLTLKKSRIGASTIALECKGKSERLKSFVRWCYNGPYLATPEEVKVEWETLKE